MCKKCRSVAICYTTIFSLALSKNDFVKSTYIQMLVSDEQTHSRLFCSYCSSFTSTPSPLKKKQSHVTSMGGEAGRAVSFPPPPLSSLLSERVGCDGSAEIRAALQRAETGGARPDERSHRIEPCPVLRVATRSSNRTLPGPVICNTAFQSSVVRSPDLQHGVPIEPCPGLRVATRRSNRRLPGFPICNTEFH